MVILVVILIVVFLYWSLVPKKVEQSTFNDIINISEKKQGKYSNVYKHKYTGVYYTDKTPINIEDKKIYSGTKNECEIYVTKRNGFNF